MAATQRADRANRIVEIIEMASEEVIGQTSLFPN